MQFNSNFIKILLTLLVLVIPLNSAFALDLNQAKSEGLVGEMSSGYLAVVDGKGSAAVNNLVSDINAKRKTEYKNIAKETGTTLTVVETLAGKKAIEKTTPGHYIQGTTGKLQKK
jgi:uncharacterized protein YdbL (DUF1318 family)